ncbi:MAG: hypothetical protein H7175_28330 [Burkholderiales bacterium]|nr:hypothetical protein [Anaerolineae bacterium]
MPKRTRQDTQELTEEVYRFICQYHKQHRISPTLREIGDGCSLSVPSVIRHLDILETESRITREPGIPRSIVPLDE